jgi:uncharacterized protein
MTFLPDVNVWLALAVAEHVHHKVAVEWMNAADDTIAFCRVTEMGFLRLLTNSRVMARDVCTAERAWRTMEAFRQDDRIVFASEPPVLERSWRTMTTFHKTGANFWTDTYLAAFVEVAGYTLVTLDRGFQKYKKLSVRILGNQVQ